MDDLMDLITAPVRAAATAFAAGVKAADENNASARRLQRLIQRCEKARDLYRKGWDAEAHAELCRAIEEARKP